MKTSLSDMYLIIVLPVAMISMVVTHLRENCILKRSVKINEVAQSCLTLCNPLDCSPPGSSVHGISQARMLEWVAISFCRRSSRLRDQTHVSCIAGRFFTTESPGMSHIKATNPIQLFLNLFTKKTKAGN